MHILLLTDNFVPETNSPALRAFDHARAWVREGEKVTVITSVPNFPLGRPLPPYRNRLYQTETLEGVRVIRVWTVMAANRGVFRRSLDFLSFALSGFTAGLFERADVIVATSPQLLTGLAGRWLATLKRKPWVFEVRDLWPDSIVSVGVMRENFFVRALRRLEHGLYRSANRIVAVSEGIRGRLIERGVPAVKIGVAPNGIDLRRASATKDGTRLREELGLRESFVVGYVGTHGMAQGLEVVLDAAVHLRGTDTHFLFVGEGARRKAIMAHARALQLDNATFVGLVPLAFAAEYIAACDAILIPLKRTDQIEITIPGKIFEAAALGKPMIVSAVGASAELMQRYGAGLVVPPEQPDLLADAVLQLRDNPKLRAGLRDGCLRLARDYDREKLAADLLRQIRSAAAR